MRSVSLYILIALQILVVSCEKKLKPIDPLSYIPIMENNEKTQAMEKHRTQIVSLNTNGDKATLVLAFAMDSTIPKDASKSARNAYGIRFTMQDSLLRSKRLGGGTLVLKLKKNNNSYSVRNFQKQGNKISRYPEYSIDSMDTIVNPEIIDIKDYKTNSCITLNCNGTLKPVKNRTYIISIEFDNIAGETWSVDHGYLDENEETREPKRILNTTASGLKIEFPASKKLGTKPYFNIDELGTL